MVQSQELRDRSDRDDLAIGDDGDTVADSIKRVEIVGDEEDGEPERVAKLGNQLVEAGGADRIEPGRGLVEEQQFRIEREGAGDAGEITVFGESMIDRDEEEAKDIRRKWGILFQGAALFSTLTVAENVQVPIREYFPHIEGRLLDEIAAYKIVMSGLAPEAGPKFPSELSGGMKKRAGIARALALDPELLFLDEPTAGLDPIGAAAFDELIRELRDALGLTVFLITHDLDSLYAICDRVAVLADRRVVAVGTIAELLALDHEWIQDYFGGPRGRAAAQGQAGGSED